MREKNVLDRSPTGLELGIPLLALLVRVAKRVVLSSPERRLRSVEAQALDSVGMRSGEQDAERASLAPAQHMGLIHPRGVHHRARVLHSLVRRRDALWPIGHTGAALVETDNARESRESLAPPHPRRLLPIERQVREPTRNHQHLRCALADHLTGDARLATPGVQDRRRHRKSVRRRPSRLMATAKRTTGIEPATLSL